MKNINLSAPPKPVTWTAISGGLAGLVLWLLSHEVFHGHAVPGPIQAAVWALIPAVVAGVGAHFAHRAGRAAGAKEAAQSS